MVENIKTTVEELHKLINVDNVIGTPIETEDKILRKMITLSNNMTIIEGIGCIDSSGTFLYYLNPGKRNHQTACLVYNMYKHKPGDYDWILWQKDYKEILISISTGRKPPGSPSS